MLRKMRSFTLLSPRSEVKLSEPTTSQVRAYRSRPSSPTKSDIERHKARESSEESPLHHLATHVEGAQGHRQVSRLKVLKRKASSIFNIANCSFVPGLQYRSESASLYGRKERQPSRSTALQLKASIVSNSDTVDTNEQDLLLMLDIRAEFQHVPSEGARGIDMVVILDLSAPFIARRRFLAARSMAAKILGALRAQDSITILTTIPGSSQDRIVLDRTILGRDSSLELEGIIFDMQLAAAPYALDLMATMHHAIDCLSTCTSDRRAAICFLSDGAASSLQSAYSSLATTLRKTDIGLYTIGLGAIKNDRCLRALAAASRSGVCMSDRDTDDLVGFVRELRSVRDLDRLEDVQLEIELFEGASIRDIADEDVQIQVESPHCIHLSLASLGVFEHRTIVISVNLPEIIECAISPTRSLNHTTTGERRAPSNSFRLAELEHMMHTLPVPLTRCAIAYKHPALSSDCIVVQRLAPCAIRRLKACPPDQTNGIGIKLARDNTVRCILGAQERHFSNDRSACLALLREAESMLHATCTELDLALSSFEDLFTEISALRFRLSPRYEMSIKRKQSYSPTSPAAIYPIGVVKNTSPLEDRAWRRTLEKFPRTPERRATRAGVRRRVTDTATLQNRFDGGASSEAKGRLPRQRTLVTTLSTVITDGRSRSRRNSTGSLDMSHLKAHLAGHQPSPEAVRVIWGTPSSSKMPSSHEVRHIIRKSSSHHDIKKWNPIKTVNDIDSSLHSFADAAETAVDAARAIWKTHRAERGEDSMTSDIDAIKALRIDDSNPSTGPELEPQSPRDYFAEKAQNFGERIHGLQTSPLRQVLGLWSDEAQNDAESEYSPQREVRDAPSASNPYFPVFHTPGDTIPEEI